ncbi:MAG TPA: hypothetical protein DCZ94_13535 [Lentisphaeria bacterium]|nr:MAG: hypothetical protein A2X48_18935 [Lentisphaerae bacterium GWF2_49_21]HBC87967.1 hypothetical protein [Lentisphaeria bacterium]
MNNRERLLPVMRSGGYIPTTDHQTPPTVSLDAFKGYVKILKEYCGKVKSNFRYQLFKKKRKEQLLRA